MIAKLHEWFLVLLDLLNIFRKRGDAPQRAAGGTLTCRVLGHKFIAEDSWFDDRRWDVKHVCYRAVDWCVRCGLTKHDLGK